MANDHNPVPDVDRCDAFWAGEPLARPLLTSWVGSYTISALYPEGLAQLPEGELKPSDIRFEPFRSDYERLFEMHRAVATDIPWAAFPVMVVPWVEAIIGCPIRHRDGNVWAEPRLDGYDSRLTLRQEWLERLLDFIDWLVDLAQGRFPVGPSLMRGPLDLLAAMRGAQRSIYDLFDCPDQVVRALDMLADVWINVVQRQLEHTPRFADGYSFTVQNLWSRRLGAWFQHDAAAFWSPRLFQAYGVDCTRRLAECMPVTGIHLHPPALFTVDALLEMPALDVIEVHKDEVGPGIVEMMPRLRQISAQKRLMLWGAFTAEELRAIRDHLPARGLALQLMGQTPTEVGEMVRVVQDVWSE
jgi:hypothetical protein